MLFHLWPSVGQMCKSTLTTIPKSNSPSCCASYNQPISRSHCWQQSYCMFGLMALHPWYNPSLMCAHILQALLAKLLRCAKANTKKMTTVALKWKCTYWKEKVMQTGNMCGKLGHWSYWSRNAGLPTYFRSMWQILLKNGPFHHDNINTHPNALTS